MIDIKITQFTQEQIEAFATFCGWSKQIMTTTESPNYLVDNPESALEYLKRTQLELLRTNLLNFRTQVKKIETENAIKEASEAFETIKNTELENVSSMVSVTLE